jgi:hypothetical protein
LATKLQIRTELSERTTQKLTSTYVFALFFNGIFIKQRKGNRQIVRM